MLDEKVNTCFGCLIALCNSIGSIDEDEIVNTHIIECLNDLKRNKNIDEWINTLREDKKRIVPDCFVCSNPCGRTSEISLNELDVSCQFDALKLIDSFDSMSLLDIYYAIGRLPYCL